MKSHNHGLARRSNGIGEVPEDDRYEISGRDAILLVVEMTPDMLPCCGYAARDKGFKVLIAGRGTDALALARDYRPTAISLDICLPDMLAGLFSAN
jgi:ActR/RegA family two-component response regulator